MNNLLVLKPCPFCGGEAKIEYDCIDGYYMKYYDFVHVICTKCGATTGRSYSDKDRAKSRAVKDWNRRVE